MNAETLDSLLDDYEKFWEGWEFALQQNKPHMFILVHECLSQLHDILIERERMESNERNTMP